MEAVEQYLSEYLDYTLKESSRKRQQEVMPRSSYEARIQEDYASRVDFLSAPWSEAILRREARRLFGFLSPLTLFNWNNQGPESIAKEIHFMDECIRGERCERTSEKLLLIRELLLQKSLLCGLVSLYGESAAALLFVSLIAGIEERFSFKKRIPSSTVDDRVTYVCYADSITGADGHCGFEEIAAIIPALSRLGISNLHILPFFNADGDGGYQMLLENDLSAPLTIPLYGGKTQLSTLQEQISKYKMSLTIDLVLNHISANSNLLKQNPDYARNILQGWRLEEIPFSRCRVSGQMAYYTLSGSGREVEIVSIFAEHSIREDFEESNPATWPHISMCDFGGRPYYVWHTFYPEQLDLDYGNPAAFRLAGSLIFQVIELLGGRGRIRLDALPYVGKEINESELNESDTNATFRLAALFRLVCALSAPDVSVITEAVRPRTELISYQEKTGQAYNFVSVLHWLISIGKGDPSHLLDCIKEMLRETGIESMQNFLSIIQTHDDVWINLKSESQATKEMFREVMKEVGAEVLSGDIEDDTPPPGYVLTLAELCRHDPRRIAAAVCAHTLGTPHKGCVLLYGTEIGKSSDHKYVAKKQSLGERTDARDLLRGPISQETIMERRPVSAKLAAIFEAKRRCLPQHLQTWDEIPGWRERGVLAVCFSGTRKGKFITVKVFVNLSEERVALDKESVDGEIVLQDGISSSLGLAGYGYLVVRMVHARKPSPTRY